MKLFSFFNKTAKTGKDSVVDSSDLLDGLNADSSEKLVDTALSYHPDWNIPKEQQYVFRFLSNELTPLKPYQISLSGIDIDENEENGTWFVKAFFRSSVDKPVSMGKVELFILSEDDNVLAAKEFDLTELGEVPPCSHRPWVFEFQKPLQKAKELPKEGWKLAFNVQSLIPHALDLDDNWGEALSNEQINVMEKMVENLPKLSKREVNFSGFQAKPLENGSLAISLFIRNGDSHHIQVQKLPLEVLDAGGDLVAQGFFDLGTLEVKANTSKPWTFIFPSETIQKNQADFTSWTVRVPQKA